MAAVPVVARASSIQPAVDLLAEVIERRRRCQRCDSMKGLLDPPIRFALLLSKHSCLIDTKPPDAEFIPIASTPTERNRL